MDHTFSSTGAIRQHHHHQSIRNSLSPSPHSNSTAAAAHFSTATNLYRISPTPLTNNILSAAAAISAGNYSQSPAAAPAGSVSSFYRVPTYSVQQQPQPQQQPRVEQQQYLHQIQQQQHPQQPCSFVTGASSPHQDISYPSPQGGSLHSTRLGVVGGAEQYPLRPNTTNNRSNIRISPTNQSLSVTSYGTPPVNAVGGQSSYSPQQLVESSGYRSGPGPQQQHRSPQVQVHQPQPQQQQKYQHQQQQYSTPPVSGSHHHQQQSQNNMNKNRYMSQHQQQQPQQTNNINGIVVPTVGGGSASGGGNGVENGNSTTANNVKALIQQVSQQNVNNNVNSSSVSVTSSSSPTTAQVPVQASPQYRIYKRGDSIPGISSPIQLTPSIPTATGGNEGGSGVCQDKENNESGGGGVSATDTQNDKENNTSSSGGGGGGGGLIKPNNSNSSSTASRTPLSQIGEIARFHSLHVEYRLVNETGPPHAPTFTVLLRIGHEEFNGQGASIKKAQHAAAEEALEKTTLAKPPPKNKPGARRPFSTGIGGGMGGGGGRDGYGERGGSKRPNWNLIQLTAVAQDLQLPLQFVQQPVPIVDPFRRGDPPSIVSVHVGDKIFTGEGSNFNSAKNMAVMIALKAMLKVKQELDLQKMVQAGADAEQNALDAENKSPISIVHEMAMKRGKNVQFEILKEEGPPHMKVFTVKCKVGEELETSGDGPTKQAAKKASSELMIAKLKEIPITVPQIGQGGLSLKAMQRGLLRQKTQKKKTSIPVVKDLEKQAVSPISRLIQIAHVKKFKEPEFTLISTGTESNVENFLKQITERDRRMLRKKKPVFTIEVTVGPHTCRGTGPNKKAAKKAAAEAAVIALGYPPTEGAGDDSTDSGGGDGESNSSPTSKSPPSAAGGSSGKKGDGSRGGHSDSGKGRDGGVKLAGARQIAPGIIVLKSESTGPGGTTSSAVAQEMKKVGNMMNHPSPAANNREGIDKLAYLSKLLEISVSYSDFPKKNEYLSVVSLTTNPPHVAHGCGKTLEEAQNAAALKILEELSTMDLDSVTAAAEKTE